MYYSKLHDRIIDHALVRIPKENVKYYKHHIIPKCEGGDIKGDLVQLTLREHRIIHWLRFKITKVVGNLKAYYLMGSDGYVINHARLNSRFAKMSHIKFKERDFTGYYERQRKAAIAAGKNSYEKQLGFYKLTEQQKTEARDKGRKTIVDNKLGMFSDDYREIHKLTLYKEIHTPDGIFRSMSEAANFYNVVAGTITYRVQSENERWSEWYYE